MKMCRICKTDRGLRFVAMLFAITCVFINISNAQEKEFERPRNAKVVKEYEDGRGNIIKEIQYTQGAMLVTQQIIMPKVYTGINGPRKPIDPDTLIRDSVMVLVNKSLYCVQVFYRKRIIRAYKAVFGPEPKRDKRMEGDRCTPEGWFKISAKNPNSKYNKFLLINYPTDSSYSKFKTLKAKGHIPSTAKIGGSIGIHGIWKGGDDMIEMGVGWTDGCIALKNRDVEELYSMIGVGTKVFIKK